MVDGGQWWFTVEPCRLGIFLTLEQSDAAATATGQVAVVAGSASAPNGHGSVGGRLAKVGGQLCVCVRDVKEEEEMKMVMNSVK